MFVIARATLVKLSNLRRPSAIQGRSFDTLGRELVYWRDVKGAQVAPSPPGTSGVKIHSSRVCLSQGGNRYNATPRPRLLLYRRMRLSHVSVSGPVSSTCRCLLWLHLWTFPPLPNKRRSKANTPVESVTRTSVQILKGPIEGVSPSSAV